VDEHTFTKQIGKVEQTLSARKAITVVFWDRKEIMKVELMHEGIKVASDVYRKKK
jgi:hypothetical protein